MVGARRSLLGGLTLCALLVGVAMTPVSSSALGDTATHEVGHVLFTGPIKGILLAKPRGKTRTRISVSLHGLQPNRAYDVVGSKRPCGKSLTNASRLFGIDIPAGTGTDAFEDITLTFAFKTLSPMKSVRIIADSTATAPVQRACYHYILGIENG